ncbi:MerR family transcriptional regulator [Rhizohabitans arisaemae]|uniref:MerR family transcriptional regulator n=1 Tax=Rhizohabitans arisaemae TaxID=2720610 RepID=UPI0024B15A42|nr:MerR family transcriptional regulator [Rhizohabitans arisaemae]
MAWSITQVARMSGVTSRTLRHYHEIGLLAPAWVSASGYRHYEESQLLRLQQILILRRLDLGLPEIKEIVDRNTDPLTALREHHRRLLAERDRLDAVALTVARTIAELDESERTGKVQKINNPENLFDGFDAAQYTADARDRWPGHWEGTGQADLLANSTPQEIEKMQREATAALVRLAELMAAGTPVDDPAVLAKLDVHYRRMSRYWTPSAEEYTHFGEMQVSDPTFRATYDRIAEGLAEYQRDAMAAYARIHLT